MVRLVNKWRVLLAAIAQGLADFGAASPARRQQLEAVAQLFEVAALQRCG